MAFGSSFEHTEKTILPLPHPKSGQTYDTVADDGLRVALSLLHNNDYMMELSPLHIKHEKISLSAENAVDVEKLAANFNVPLNVRQGGESEWQHYEIHDQVPILFGYKKEIVFQTALRNVSTGMESLTNPGNTVTIHGRYDVSRTPNDPTTLTLTERTTTHCNVVLSWFIKSNLGSSHGNIHRTIKARFVEEMQKL